MYLSLRGHHIPFAHLFRDLAAVCGAALAAGWLGLLVLEAIRTSQWIPNLHSYDQALVLAIVFASYAIGWRHALVGAALSLAGTVVFFAVGYASTGAVPPLSAVGLAMPGVMYLLAWIYDDRRHGTNLHIRKY